jgi:hypothetical protein
MTQTLYAHMNKKKIEAVTGMLCEDMDGATPFGIPIK